VRFFRHIFNRGRARDNFERELDAEVRGYFETVVHRSVAGGLSPEEARRAARLQFGTPEQIKENVRDVRMGATLESAIRDILYALRTLRKSPGFALLAVLTLALGIGASTAIFTIVDAVLLKPLAFRNSGDLVVVWERLRFLAGGGPLGPNPRHADLWAKRSTAFSGIALVRQSAQGLSVGAEHPRIAGTIAAYTNIFEVLEVTPLLGRSFRPEDGVPGHDKVVVLTWPLWQTSFQADPNVIGKIVHLAGKTHEVVGVLPQNFRFPNANALHAFRSKQGAASVPEPAVFVPAALQLDQFSWNGEYGNWVALARLKSGKGIRQAETQLNSIEAQIVRDNLARGSNDDPGALQAFIQPMQEAVVGDAKTELWFLLAAVLGLMLIACLNLANAQLGRALSRDREVAVRSALGASRWQLLRASVAESILLAVAGGAFGVLSAAGALNIFRRFSPVDVPRLAEVHINIPVLLFAIALTAGAGLLFGTLPALRFFRSGPQGALQKNSGRNAGSRQSRVLRNSLIGVQVFGCTVLLLVTGLFSKSLLLLLRSDKGFSSTNTVVAEVRLSSAPYESNQSRIGFNDAVLAGLRQLPGVQSAALISSMPLEGESWIEQLQRTDKPGQETPLLNLRWVSPGYFETISQKLVAGRFFEERDRNLTTAVVSEGLAKAVWPNENPIGAEVRIEGRKFTIIGVAADSRTASLKSPAVNTAWVHYKDRPPSASFFLARGLQPAEQLISGVRQTIWNYAPDTTIARIKTLDSQLSDSIATERFQTGILLAFGSAALLLAMLGIYGVLSFSISCRKQEIGVRMALGATRKKIYALTVGEAVTPVITGLAAGLITGAFAGRVVNALLYGLQPVDPSVMALVTALFITAAVAAAFLPARRAASVDAMDALRTD
jgi:predicted permease